MLCIIGTEELRLNEIESSHSIIRSKSRDEGSRGATKQHVILPKAEIICCVIVHVVYFVQHQRAALNHEVSFLYSISLTFSLTSIYSLLLSCISRSIMVTEYSLE